jgi:hypothetical protein
VAVHGNAITVEDCAISAWARLWGKRIQVFSPGMLIAALAAECRTTGGRLQRAGTRSTVLSQHCLCGKRVPKTLAQPTPQRDQRAGQARAGSHHRVASAEQRNHHSAHPRTDQRCWTSRDQPNSKPRKRLRWKHDKLQVNS